MKSYRSLEEPTILHYVIEIETDLSINNQKSTQKDIKKKNNKSSFKTFNANLDKTKETIKLLVDDLSIILDILHHNYLGAIPIKKINIKLTTEPIQNLWLLKDVFLDKKYYKQGEELKISVVYQLYQSQNITKILKKKIFI